MVKAPQRQFQDSQRHSVFALARLLNLRPSTMVAIYQVAKFAVQTVHY